jgi:hypothetical protein
LDDLVEVLELAKLGIETLAHLDETTERDPLLRASHVAEHFLVDELWPLVLIHR